MEEEINLRRRRIPGNSCSYSVLKEVERNSPLLITKYECLIFVSTSIFLIPLLVPSANME